MSKNTNRHPEFSALRLNTQKSNANNMQSKNLFEVDHRDWDNVKMPVFASNRASAHIQESQKRAIQNNPSRLSNHERD
jgi:hypothetical protein